jgi:hypothetical protein
MRWFPGRVFVGDDYHLIHTGWDQLTAYGPRYSFNSILVMQKSRRVCIVAEFFCVRMDRFPGCEVCIAIKEDP